MALLPIEDVLNRIRLYRELLSTSSTKEHSGLDLEALRALDSIICKAIYESVSVAPVGGLGPYLSLARWLYAFHANRDASVEIFTTNYDLLLERSFEEVNVPFFDGFIGSVEPFFSLASLEADQVDQGNRLRAPLGWTRFWKLHGSIAWRLRTTPDGSSTRVIRRGDLAPTTDEQLMIFPSRDKYVDSRRLPFLAFQDHFRRFLSNGETVLLVIGYSFSDQHINELILDALRSNRRLAVTALMFLPSMTKMSPPAMRPNTQI
jgi:hypothetical protein